MRFFYDLKINSIRYLLLIAFIFISCGNESIDSQRSVHPIAVNGISDDWKDYYQFLFKDWGVIYSVINDDTSLSLMFQFRDPQLARKINMRGLTLWINSDGDKEKVAGIHYENRKLMDALLDNMAEGKRMFTEKPDENFQGAERESPENLSGTFSLIDGEGYVITSNGKDVISGAADKKDGNYCFEFNIKPSAENGLSLTPDTDLMLGIEISAVSDEVIEMMNKRKSGRMDGKMEPQDGGIPGGGMRGGGRHGGGMGGYLPGGKKGKAENIMDAQEVWFSVTLAK